MLFFLFDICCYLIILTSFRQEGNSPSPPPPPQNEPLKSPPYLGKTNSKSLTLIQKKPCSVFNHHLTYYVIKITINTSPFYPQSVFLGVIYPVIMFTPGVIVTKIVKNGSFFVISADDSKKVVVLCIMLWSLKDTFTCQRWQF